MKLQDYYGQYKEDDRLIKDNAHRVEFETTVEILKGYLNGTHSILDVGAGTGRYSFYFADLGYEVTAFEYTDANIALLNQKNKVLSGNKSINILQGDGRDLSRFEDNSYDVVLCMDPIYHLGLTEDKMKCIAESIRVAKPGNIVAFAYLNKFAQYANSISNDENSICDPYVNALICDNKELLNEMIFKFDSPSEIEDMMSKYCLEKVAHIGADGISYLLKNQINSFDEKVFQKWLNNHLKTCYETSILGYSLHGLFIGRKSV